MNIQPIEKYVSGLNGALDVHSIFYTIQGEGPFTGHPAVFIRLAGCNLKCPACDTQYTEGRQTMTTEQIMAKVRELTKHKEFTRTLIVISGGEPLRQQNIKRLLEAISYVRYYVQIETNGTMPFVQGSFHMSQNPSAMQGVYIVVSPKMQTIQASVLKYACAVKYVATAESLIGSNDGLPLSALDLSQGIPLCRTFGVPIYLQPQDDKNEHLNRQNMRACVESCLKHGYILQLQTHKILGVE